MLGIFDYEAVEPVDGLEIQFERCKILDTIDCDFPAVEAGDEIPIIRVDLDKQTMKFINDEGIEYAEFEISTKVQVVEFT